MKPASEFSHHEAAFRRFAAAQATHMSWRRCVVRLVLLVLPLLFVAVLLIDALR